MKRGDIELMAPAGSMESLTAAVQAGADAIYFGLDKLNMRARSSVHFTIKDLPTISAITKDAGVKSYLALNTILYDADLDTARELIMAAKQYEISAVIVSDQAVLDFALEAGVEIHLSTQLNISNFESLKFYSRYADVVVLARELSLEQIKEIDTKIHQFSITGPSGNPVKLELFAHGALCMAISGKCYLSLHQYNHSANRGECFQGCRRGYIVTDAETGDQLEIDNQYIMSPKDLCTIEFLDRILEAGIRVLKIEGRARSAEYVNTVVGCYNEALLALENGIYSEKKILDWKDRLSSVFNRGFWGGYYLGKRLGEWSDVYGSKATRRKEFLGKVNHYYPKPQVAEFKIETGNLEPGDDLLFIGPTTGIRETMVEEIHMDSGPVNKGEKGDIVAVRVPDIVRKGDQVYKWIYKV